MLNNSTDLVSTRGFKIYTKRQLSTRLSVVLMIFLLLNSLKLTMFNFFIMSDKTAGSFMYKLLFSIILLALIYSFIYSIKSPIVFIIVYVAEAIYIFSNLSYYGYFHNYLHLFQSAALFTEGVGSIKHFTIPVDVKDLIIFIDVPFFIYLIKSYKDINEINSYISKYRKYAAAAFLVIIVSSEVWSYHNNNCVIQIARDYSTGEHAVVARFGTVTNNFFDIIFNEGGKNLVTHLKEGKTITNTAASGDKPNIVAIQVESLDANVISKVYNGKYITPNLHSLAESNIYYPYTMSYHKAGGTSDSEFSTMNSVEPLTNFPSIKLGKYDYPNSLVKVLNNNSYDTIAFHGNIGNYYNRDVAFNKMGFKEFDDIRKMGYKDTGWGAPDDKVFEYELNKLSSEKGPFFSYTITMTSHTPFTNAANYYNNNNYDSIKDERVKNYFNSVSYVDEAISNFVNEIRNKYKNTYVLIWGDHTPDVNGDDYKQAAYVSGDDYFEFVPLIIITPDNKNYKETKEVASFLDIAPTILYASNSNFTYKSDGENLIIPSESKGKIPFKEKIYDRSDLFKKVSSIK